MFERFTDTARRVIVLAQDEARLLRHHYIGSEHLLLALSQEDVHPTSSLLRGAEATHAMLRTSAAELTEGSPTEPSGHIPFTLQAKKILEGSLRSSRQSGSSTIGPEHLLASLLHEPGHTGHEMLRSLGVDSAQLQDAVAKLTMGDRAGTPAPVPPPEIVEHPSECTHPVASLRWDTAEIEGLNGSMTAVVVVCSSCGSTIGVMPA